MPARDRDLAAGAGGARGLEHGFVGIGDALDETPDTLAEAVTAVATTIGLTRSPTARERRPARDKAG